MIKNEKSINKELKMLLYCLQPLVLPAFIFVLLISLLAYGLAANYHVLIFNISALILMLIGVGIYKHVKDEEDSTWNSSPVFLPSALVIGAGILVAGTIFYILRRQNDGK